MPHARAPAVWRRPDTEGKIKNIEVLSGSFGPGYAELTDHGLALEDRFLPFSVIKEISIQSIDMGHSIAGPAGGLPLIALFGIGGYPIASTMWAGNVMIVTFCLETHAGEHLLAQADNDEFSLLKERYLED